MAKNTSSSAFRKIDVDQYNEDNFEEDDVETGNAATGPDENEITKLLTQYPLQIIIYFMINVLLSLIYSKKKYFP